MGLSENEASNNIGISTRDLKNIESGKNVDAYLLIRIIPMFADDYNVPLDYLFGLSDESNVVDRRLPVNKYIPKDADLDVLKSVLRSEFYTYKNMTCRMYKNEMIISKYLNVFLKTVSLLRLVRNDADCLLKTDVESEKSTGIIRKLDAVLSFQRDIERVIKGSSLGRYVDV